jgi:hypothetical protein
MGDERLRAGKLLFDDLGMDYLGRDGVTRARMFASDGLAVGGKFFAFVGRGGKLVVKIPREEVQRRIAAGSADPVTIGERTMREWAGIPLPDGDDPAAWEDALAAAYTFVAGTPL